MASSVTILAPAMQDSSEEATSLDLKTVSEEEAPQPRKPIPVPAMVKQRTVSNVKVLPQAPGGAAALQNTIQQLVPDEKSLAADEQSTMFHPAEVELQQTMDSVFAAVERVGARRVVLDSLSEMRLLARDPLRFRRQILALKQFFSGRNVTVLCLDDRTSEFHDIQLQSVPRLPSRRSTICCASCRSNTGTPSGVCRSRMGWRFLRWIAPSSSFFCSSRPRITMRRARSVVDETAPSAPTHTR